MIKKYRQSQHNVPIIRTKKTYFSLGVLSIVMFPFSFDDKSNYQSEICQTTYITTTIVLQRGKLTSRYRIFEHSTCSKVTFLKPPPEGTLTREEGMGMCILQDPLLMPLLPLTSPTPQVETQVNSQDPQIPLLMSL